MLVLLDVPDDPDDAVLETALTGAVIGAEAGEAGLLGEDLDEELEQLTDEVGLEVAPEDPQPL